MDPKAADFQIIVNNKVQAGQWINENKGKNFALGATQVVLPVLIALGAALVIYLAVMHGQTGHSWLQILDKSWHWINSGTTLAHLVKFGVPAYIVHMLLGLCVERGTRDHEYKHEYKKAYQNKQSEKQPEEQSEKQSEEQPEESELVDYIDIVGCKRPENKINARIYEVTKRLNGYNIFGYFPVVGVAAGMHRMRDSIEGKCLDVTLTGKARALNFVRGVVEALGIGIVFLVPDLVAGGCKRLEDRGNR